MKKDKLPSIKSLHTKASTIWKDICYRRDGRVCMVQKFFPEIKIIHNDVFQVDHGISRSCSWTFYMPENGTVVCSSCNMAKGFNNKSVHRAIDEIIIIREGQEKFDEMVHLDRTKTANRDFNRRGWIEEQITMLEQYLKDKSWLKL